MSREDDIARKTRTLKKYEGHPTVFARDDTTPPFTMMSPFGPLIGQTEFPDHLIRNVNAYADEIATPGLGSEFLVSPTFAASGHALSLLSYLKEQIHRFVCLSEEKAPTQIDIDVIWIISQYEGTPSPVHFHSGDVSGVIYLKAPPPPEPNELMKNYISGRHAGYLNFMTGGKQRFAKTLFSVPPVVGACYIFPGWLLHGAEPFRGPGERRSMSFNATVGPTA